MDSILLNAIKIAPVRINIPEEEYNNGLKNAPIKYTI
jgi:hypothetical protein